MLWVENIRIRTVMRKELVVIYLFFLSIVNCNLNLNPVFFLGCVGNGKGLGLD